MKTTKVDRLPPSITQQAVKARNKPSAPDWMNNRHLIKTDVTREQYEAMGRAKQIPAGSTHSWRHSAIYGPKGGPPLEQDTGNR